MSASGETGERLAVSVTLASQTGERYAKQHLHQPVLSRRAVSGEKDSLPRRTLSVDCVLFTPTKSCWKNLAATIRALASLAGSSRTAAFGGGLYDGSLRNYFFQELRPCGGAAAPPAELELPCQGLSLRSWTGQCLTFVTWILFKRQYSS